MENKLWQFIETRMKKKGVSIQWIVARDRIHTDKARIYPDVLYRLRSDGRPPSDNALAKISTFLGLDLEELKKLRALLPKYTKIIICERCGKPGEVLFSCHTLKYPHEECRDIVQSQQTNDFKREYKKEHGRPYHNRQLENLPQNEIVLENKKKRAKRLCLRCDKLFDSKGPYNRICNSCTASRGEEIKYEIPVYRTSNTGYHVARAQ